MLAIKYSVSIGASDLKAYHSKDTIMVKLRCHALLTGWLPDVQLFE